MKQRPRGFLSKEHINHNSEIFYYIKELHLYLWRLARIIEPGVGGDLFYILDKVIERAKK